MGRVIIRGIVKRHQGFLYFIDSKGNLCMDIYEPAEHLNKKYSKLYKARELAELESEDKLSQAVGNVR